MPDSPKKRVLFVITQSELGGAQQFLSQLISHLDRERFDVSVAVGADGNHAFRTLLPADVPYGIIPSLRRSPNVFRDLRSVVELGKFYRREQPDIIFLNSSKAGFNGSLAAWLFCRSARVVYRIGGWQFNDPLPKPLRWFYILLEQISARWKDDIVVNNAHDLQDAHRLRIIPKKDLHLIHNGIDPYREFLDRDQARVKLLSDMERSGSVDRSPMPQNPKIIGAIANFYSTKGLSYLIDAAAELPDEMLVAIIGDGSLRGSLERQISERNLGHKVFLLGHMPSGSLLIPGFDVFVLPSVKEGFPWVVLEAQAARIPVVATHVGAIPEVIRNGESGLIVPPKDSHALAQAIMQMLNDERSAMEMTIQAHQTLLKNFSIRTMIERYERLLAS